MTEQTATDAEILELWKSYNPLHGIQSFARAVLAKWGSPVVAGEPFGYFHQLLDHEGNGNGVWLGTAKREVTEQAHTPGETGEEIVTLYTTPQPTQAQAGAVPLTDNELVRLSRVGAIQTDDSGKVVLWPASYKTQMEDRFKSGWREAEKHHGITKEGVQHGAD